MKVKQFLVIDRNMATEEIIIRVDPETARAFNSTSAQEPRKL